MQRLVVATANPGKRAEFATLLADFDFAVESLEAHGIEGPQETAPTFVENALIKARHAARVSGLPALADDSGLVVDALGGAPGVRSARYAGPSASDADNIVHLLAATAHLAGHERRCRFVCVLVLLRHADDPLPVIASGQWEGELLSAPRGAGGFGYDPVFFDARLGASAAELTPARKNAVSHRGLALAALRAALVPAPS